MTQSIIDVQALHKTYPSSNKAVLENVSLTIKRGEIVAFLGKSGCGKTTLLNMIGGFEPASSGDILLDGERVTKPSQKSIMLLKVEI